MLKCLKNNKNNDKKSKSKNKIHDDDEANDKYDNT